MAVLEEIIVDHLTLTSTDITNKYVTLSRTPVTPTEVSMTTDTPQDYDTDYYVEGKTLKWDGKLLDGFLEAGDEMQVIYSTDGSLNTFAVPPERDGNYYTSTINKEAVLEITESDSYFNAEAKFYRVDVTYVHEDNRQSETIIHFGPNLTGRVNFSTFARAGVWKKMRLRVKGFDGAIRFINRTEIGEEQDLTLT